ncbi:MAG: hypothetical protein IJT83_15560 [Victivallales bacterium]|nr:hypothetical protein [Victivallales bacterium]MBQ9369200.1 hypothetical protein [Victivallales bacterium]
MKLTTILPRTPGPIPPTGSRIPELILQILVFLGSIASVFAQTRSKPDKDKKTDAA